MNRIYKIKLTRLSSSHNNLRSDVVEGYCLHLPKAGHEFVAFSTALDGALKDDPNAFRMVRTSPVHDILEVEEDILEVFTENSKYRVEILGQELVEINPFTRDTL